MRLDHLKHSLIGIGRFLSEILLGLNCQEHQLVVLILGLDSELGLRNQLLLLLDLMLPISLRLNLLPLLEAVVLELLLRLLGLQSVGYGIDQRPLRS